MILWWFRNSRLHSEDLPYFWVERLGL